MTDPPPPPPESAEETSGQQLRRRIAEGAAPDLGWAERAERAGHQGLALREYQRAMAHDPCDATALRRLAILYEERGDVARAIDCAERLATLAPDDATPFESYLELLLAAERFGPCELALAARGAPLLGEPGVRAWRRRLEQARGEPAAVTEEPGAGSEPSEADVVRFAHLFAGREGVYARQWWSERGEGGYSPVREPFSVHVARQHLQGTITVGIYPVRLDGTVLFCVFDLDLTKRAIARARGDREASRALRLTVAAEARRLHDELLGLELPTLLEDSGYKGRHLWLLLAEPLAADVARNLGLLVLRCLPPQSPDVQVELFPKQTDPGRGVGNLVKLPLGIHRRTGRRCRILGANGEPLGQPFTALAEHPRLRPAALHAAIERLKERAAAAPPAPGAGRQRCRDEVRADPGAGATPAENAWTSAHFEVEPELRHLLRHCPVLAELRRKAERERRLSYDERVVITHALGHSAPGVAAVNYLFRLCSNVPATEQLVSPLRGSPISCPRIRKRIPAITAQLPCNCPFDFAPERYPTPRLHLLTMAATGDGELPPADELAPARDTARALLVLRRRREQLAGEIEGAERQLAEALERAGGALDLGDTVVELVGGDGEIPTIVYQPRTSPSSDPASPVEEDPEEDPPCTPDP